MDLAELISRVEKATGPDRELDVAIGALWPDPPFNVTTATLRNMKPSCPAFTSSIDAAIALCERVLPKEQDWLWKVFMDFGGAYFAEIKVDVGTAEPKYHVYKTDHETPALALLLALLRALQHQGGTE